MAIVKVGTYRNPPEDITDYEAIVSHLEAYTRQLGSQAMILTEWTNDTTQPKIAMGSYISHGGVLYVVDTEDYVLPALSSDGTYYLRVAASGDTLALSWISNLTGYAWNAIANGLYHADESQVLPYQVVKNGALVEKYKMLNSWQNDDFAVVNYLGRYHGRELHVTGAISGATVDTGKVTCTSIDSYKSSINIISGGLYPDYSGISYGDVELTYPTTTGSFTTTVSNTTYQEVKSIKLIEDVFTAMDPESEYHILGVRLVITNKGSSGANNAQYRIKINGVVAYESPMERGGVVYNIDLSCNEHDIITIECRSSNAGSVVVYENYYLRFNRDTTKSERLIEYAKRTFGIF